VNQGLLHSHGARGIVFRQGYRGHEAIKRSGIIGGETVKISARLA
jgi:hypothetical protein